MNFQVSNVMQKMNEAKNKGNKLFCHKIMVNSMALESNKFDFEYALYVFSSL